MTNENLLRKNIIESNEFIEIYYNNQISRLEIKLDKNTRFIKDFKEINLDVTIVEILSEDNINEEYFLLPDLNYINEYKIIKDKNIYISTFPKGKNICSFKGKIKEINNDEFIHTANAIEDSSGSPIFLENSKNVIGINKQGRKDENFADFIFTIINLLEKNE